MQKSPHRVLILNWLQDVNWIELHQCKIVPDGNTIFGSAKSGFQADPPNKLFFVKQEPCNEFLQIALVKH